MKTTFKKIAAAIAITAAASATFAVSYSGDLQLQLGWQGANTTVTDVSATVSMPAPITMTMPIQDTEFLTNAFYLGVSNYNLFNLNNLFSVGFFDKLDMSIGGSNKMKLGGNTIDEDSRRFALNFIIGPAAAVRIVDIVKLQLGVGFVGGVEIARRASDDISDGEGTGVVGFATELQAKFLPRTIVSPLVGFQYAYRGAGSFKYKTAYLNMPATFDGHFRAHSYAVYAGASWNFGDR